MTVVLKNTLDEFETLTQCLILNVELEALSVLLVNVTLCTLNLVSKLRVCLQQVCYCIHRRNQPFSCCIHLFFVLFEVKVLHCATGTRSKSLTLRKECLRR